jgi:formate hydrogenlyase subunit 4
MTVVIGFLAECLHIALIAAAAPTLAGVMALLQARLTGRGGGAPILQPWRDLASLRWKQSVIAESASRVSEFAPIACVAAVTIVACLVPSFTRGMILSPFADLVAIAGLLALGRVAQALLAMDAGSALTGKAASRTILLGCGIDMALLLAIFAFALSAGSTNLDQIAATQLDANSSLIPACVAVALAGLVDAGGLRREPLALELSGMDLAYVEGADMLRLLVWFNLLGAICLPFGMAASEDGPTAWLLGLVCWLARTLLFALGLTILRAMLERLKLPRAAGMLGVAMLLGVLAIVLLFSSMRTA